jgi:hypothetical protein
MKVMSPEANCYFILGFSGKEEAAPNCGFMVSVHPVTSLLIKVRRFSF